MVKRFSLRKEYTIALVRSDENNMPHTWTVVVRYIDKAGNTRKFIDGDYIYLINGTRCRIIDRYSIKRCIAIVDVANIISGRVISY